MFVTVAEITRNDVIQLRKGVAGYRGAFSCPLVSGPAIFVPSSGMDQNLEAGCRISVETDQVSISDFTILASPAEPTMGRLEVPGDYSIVGSVELNQDDEVFYIDVEGFSFSLDIDDTSGKTPKAEAWVSFNLHGLSLWDGNL